MTEALKYIKTYQPSRIIIEATGRLELPFACTVPKAKLPIVVANALHVDKFASSTGQLTKTDKLYAQVIAHYCEALKPHLTEKSR